ncbi:DAK2 domain-containing protein, partial [Streptomyces sp. 150FB]|uniref:DAK2 domain-containing protein n=1 Tax=Streptomyces sp. 150FB TaxID=1576605 RepID=UPI000697D612
MSSPSPSPSKSVDDLTFVVRAIARTSVDNERAFSDLDAVAGDGDFGYSLARGFEIVLGDWDDLASDSPADFLKKVALVISKRVGGTSGPLWGTAFLRAAGAVKDRPELNAADAVAMLRAAAEGIKTRGKSDIGDKTLLDALIPMTDALEQRLADGEPAAGG